VTSSGLMDEGYPKSEETGTPYTDDWTFKFTVKRIGRPAETGTWTWADSKRAGFDAPKTKDGRNDTWSPWTRFTRRMMQWKARNFVMRDNFGDVLKGMKTVEDLHDLDAVPMTRSPEGTYSAEPSTASDLSEAIQKKTAEQGRVEQKEEKPPTEEKPEPTSDERETTDQEQGKVEETTTPDFRSEWINTKGPGFSTYFYKNRAAFEAASIELKEEARVKWLKLYPKTPWPLDKIEENLLYKLEMIDSDITNELSPEIEERKTINAEINKYPLAAVNQAQENLELPTNRAYNLDESNLLLAECQRLAQGGGEDLA